MPVIPSSELASVRDSLRRTSLHDRIVHELGVRIVRAEFAPGDFLPTETVLSQELGVSRNALREAIKVLARKGLVEVRQKVGTRIRSRGDWSLLDREVLEWMTESGHHLHHILDLTEFRLIFEPKASYLAAKRATSEEISAIKEGCEALEKCIGQPFEYMAKVDLLYHRRILEASHNDVLIHLGSLISSLMQMQVVTTTVDEDAFRLGLRHHRTLADAIADRDSERAEAAARVLVTAPYTALANSNDLPADKRLR
jgi:GntR family transcriptional regulator, galactonate operon transcriptional repressor